MSREQARAILMLYRPGTADADVPEIQQATAVARQDPGLAAWFKEHCAFQHAIRTTLRQMEVPRYWRAALRRRLGLGHGR